MKSFSLKTPKNIIRATYRLFLTENIERVTISDIEKATDRTRGAIFHYFQDKQDLFEKTVEEQYFVQLKKHPYQTDKPVDFDCFIDSYQSPSERLIAHIKQLDENINAEKAFYHFTLQAGRYYPGFDAIYSRILEDEYVQVASILSKSTSYSKTQINMVTSLLISNNCSNIFFAFPSFNIQNKQIIKSLLQK